MHNIEPRSSTDYESPLHGCLTLPDAWQAGTRLPCCDLQAVEACVYLETPFLLFNSALGTTVGRDILMTFMLEGSFCLSSSGILP